MATPPATQAHILGLVRRYLAVLGQSDLPMPHLVVANNLGSRTLGLDRWSSRDPLTTTMTLQRSILIDPRTLERVVAHETIHHVQFCTMGFKEHVAIKMGFRKRGSGHGNDFLIMAARINQHVGDPTFVTVQSDQGYVKAPNTKPFVVLAGPVSGPKLGFAWAVRLSPKSLEYVQRRMHLDPRMRLVTTTDEAFTNGPRIGDGRYAVPDIPDRIHALAILYERGATYVIPPISEKSREALEETGRRMAAATARRAARLPHSARGRTSKTRRRTPRNFR